MAHRPQLEPLLVPASGAEGVRTPKTAELVAATLRRMIVDRRLTEGDFLPHEADLMAHFGVSRPTLREAVRVLESERLVEVRRGSRTGARVCVPGPEIVARPAALLLELSGATLGDVMLARTSIESLAARLVAESKSVAAQSELRDLIAEIPNAWRSGHLASASATLHRRLVELSGNPALGIMAGMLHEIVIRHTRVAIHHNTEHTLPRIQFDKLMRSYEHLLDVVVAGDGREAEAHWRRHMENAGASMLEGYENARVLDLMA